jgi:protein-S-isoprenylcysteine O-methyltransferase Ste14
MLGLVKNRIWYTRVFAVLLVGLICTMESKWDHISRLADESLYFVGGVLVAIGVIGRVWCFSYISGKKNAVLVQEGPYSMTRNPLYLFSLIAYIGLGFATETFTMVLLMSIAFSAYYPIVIRSEEAYLKNKFGNKFDSYCKRVPRFWPKFSLLEENLSVNINGVVFRKGLMDVIWFIVLFALLSLLEMCHQVGYMPTFYHLY